MRGDGERVEGIERKTDRMERLRQWDGKRERIKVRQVEGKL